MNLFELIKTGGWLMGPIVLCSIVATAIIFERLWTMRSARVMPVEVIPQLNLLCRSGEIDPVQLRLIRNASPLGTILAEGLAQRGRGRDAVKEAIEQTGRHVVHSLERYLNTLGTIAAIAPYLGLLGSVLGMIKVFSVFSAAQGASDPALLARGISEILFATAAGLAVAIPSLMFHRYFLGRVDELALRMEEEAVRFMAALEAAGDCHNAV